MRDIDNYLRPAFSISNTNHGDQSWAGDVYVCIVRGDGLEKNKVQLTNNKLVFIY